MSSNALVDLANDAIANYINGNTEALDNTLDQRQTSAATGYMRFNGNTGDWIIGKSGIATQPSLWAMHCLMARAQWIAFSNGRPTDRKSALMIEGGFDKLPSFHELPPVEKIKQPDGWKQQIVMPVFDMEGEEGQLELSLHADDDRRPVWGLMAEWRDYAKLHRTAEKPILIPVVEIGNYDFDSQGGKKYGPVLNVVDWTTPEDMEDLLATDGDVDDQDETPAVEPPKSSGAKGRFNNRKGGRTA